LEYFLVLTRFNNFTKASKYLGITQAALSQQIKNLEEELGAPLFIRKKNKNILTPAGKVLESYCWKIKQQIYYMKDELADNSDNSETLPSVKISLSLNDLEFHLVDTLISIFTDIKVTPIISDNVIDDILTLKSDIGITPTIDTRKIPACINAIHQYSHDYVIIVRKNHPILNKKFDINSLILYPFVFFSPHCKESPKIYEWIETNLKTIKNIINVDSIELVLRLVYGSDSFSIVPDYLIPQLIRLNIKYIKYNDLPRREISVYLLKEKYLNRNIRKIFNTLL
ncbi:LysR family transcriptional regulator, partial [Enterococcus faecalis]|nr:LysR family transcriptional regulator [Enterococcus faecalis]